MARSRNRRPCAESRRHTACEPLESRVMLAAAVTTVAPMESVPISEAVSFNGAYYFFAARPSGDAAELWKTDGATSAGTSVVTTVPFLQFPQDTFRPDPYPLTRYEPAELVVADGAMYFITTVRGTAGSLPTKTLWRTDGTAAGTQQLMTMSTTVVGLPGSAERPVAFGDHAYFAGFGSGVGRELFRTNPAAPGGVELFKDLWPGPSSSAPAALQVVGGRLYFSAEDSLNGIPTVGRMWLWESDGTPEGTIAVAKVGADWDSGPPSVGRVVPVGDALLYTARSTLEGIGVWRVDRAGGADRPREMLGVVPYPGPMTPFGDGVIIGNSGGDVGSVHGLWKSDGTAGGTKAFVDLAPRTTPGAGGAKVGVHAGDGGFVEHGGALLFFHNNALWRTDGTAGGTTRVGAFPSDSTATTTPWGHQLRTVDGVPVFVACQADGFGDGGARLMVSDGTPAGTREVPGLPGPAGRILGQLPGGGVLVSTLGGGTGGFLVRVDDPGAAAPAGNRASFADAGGGVGGYVFDDDPDSIRFDASGSFDADGDALSYAWDLNGDDVFTDAAGPTPDVHWSHLQLLFLGQAPPLERFVRVRVTDARGASADSAPAKLTLYRSRNFLIDPESATVALPDAEWTGFTFRVTFSAAAPLDEVTLRNGAARLTGPGGYDAAPTVVAVEGNVAEGDAFARPVVTYRFAAPGGSADPADVGNYLLTFPAGSLLDADGNTLPLSGVSTRAMLELSAPTGVLLDAPPPTADQVYEFTAVFADDTGIDPASLDDSAVTLRRVEGSAPTTAYDNVWVQSRVAAVTQRPDGSWAVTYQVYGTHANGLLFRDGTYEAWNDTHPMFDTVSDVTGNQLPATALGRFEVSLPKQGPDVWLTDPRGSWPDAPVRGGRGKLSFGLAGEEWRGWEEPPLRAPPVDVAVYLTKHLRPRPGDLLLASLPARTPGTEKSPTRHRVSFRIPAGLGPGEWRITAVADSAQALNEPNEANNREGGGFPEQFTGVGVRAQPPARPQRRGGVVSLVLGISNYGTVVARGTAVVTVVLTPIDAATGAAIAGFEPVSARATVRLNVRRTGQDEFHGARVRLKGRVPADWPAGAVMAEFALEPDAPLASLDRRREWTSSIRFDLV